MECRACDPDASAEDTRQRSAQRRFVVRLEIAMPASVSRSPTSTLWAAVLALSAG